MLARYRLFLFTVITIIGLALPLALSQEMTTAQGTAQDITTSPANIIIQGPVQAVNANIVTIANLDIVVGLDDPILQGLQAGDVIGVEGNVFEVEGDTVLVVPISITRLDTNIVVPVVTIEGPVQAINGNIITVYGIDIQLAPNDPLSSTLDVGSVVVVNGNMVGTGATVVVVVVTIVVIDVTAPTPTLTPAAEQTPEVTPEAAPELTPEATAEATPGSDDDGDDDDLPIIIVIEGPIQAINVNIITIYNINIEVSIDDPILIVIKVGDNVRVEGEIVGDDDDSTIVIIAVTIIIINVEVFINDDSGEVWRDDEGCGNGPPPWAPAHGWRARCGGGSGDDDDGGGRGNRGRGRGNNDDDD